jgi:1-phosphofructokinase
MIYTVTLNPALDKTVEIPSFNVGIVNRITKMRTDPGGKGINVSKVIDKLGGKSIAVGILGGATGNAVKLALDKLGVISDFKFIEGETRTNLKVVDPINHTNTDINELGITVTEDILDSLLNSLIERLCEDDIVILSGSLPKGAPVDTYGKWIKSCKEKGAKVILDADGEILAQGIKASPYLIKPNEHELSGLLGYDIATVDEIKKAAVCLIEKYKIEKIVVSMGDRGALYMTRDWTAYAKGLKVSVGSTVGAGDSVVAALAIAEENNMGMEETVRLSTATGAANVMCSGTQAAEYDTIKELMPKVAFFEV